MDGKLWEQEQWTDLEHIRGEAKIFLMRHNNRQDWKYRKTDIEAVPNRKLPEDFEIDANNLPITEGKVHFIRQVKENGTISVLNEDFSVSESLAHEYVWATLRHKTGTNDDLLSREERRGGRSYQDCMCTRSVEV